ncbi:hypothetical protein F441_01611 [Phytophthora nicotianae CJ01A1]|uniref:Uncharacterized protein n=3 Tax=Phytophthora nicotianae TaxID=4792 RepID=V9FW50_PHYNI|nr:hypothetical protein F443_01647 [Phytophthora nicotianae P1569]ETL48905.1 hypothetical protein L916_01539 [Phytophthora nicotianae]ETP25533.1 hypothetical protein F441_01611 [Phytophthora nicotianae CJ01A1]
MTDQQVVTRIRALARKEPPTSRRLLSTLPPPSRRSCPGQRQTPRS